MRTGLLAEFTSPDAIKKAAVEMRAKGYKRLEAFTTVPMEDLEEILAIPRSKVPLVVLAAGSTGGIAGFLFQYWANGIDYPLNVGGRPLFSAPANIPITFESVVLFSAITAFTAVFLFSGLPRLWHPLFEVPGFERASIDRYFLGVETDDPKFDAEKTREALTSVGAARVETVGRKA